jgi:hypothetical protein
MGKYMRKEEFHVSYFSPYLYYHGSITKDDEEGGVCNTHGAIINVLDNLVKEYESKR